MAEYTANAAQVVATNGNIIFTNTVIPGGKYISYNSTTGTITIKCPTCQCGARFRIVYSGNIATSGASGEGSIGVVLNGSLIDTSTMTVTTSATGEYYNVSKSLYVIIPSGNVSTIQVQAVSTNSVSAMNSSLLVDRVA